MLPASLLLVAILVPQQPPTCKDVEVCRAEALIAHAKKDYEAFHDLAWAAYNKGKNNDPELMLLVARAQSLSGRPGDALVMLERIAALGGTTDALTSDDFAKVRALPRWTEIEPKLAASTLPANEPAKAATAATRPEPNTPEPKPDAKKPEPPAPANPEAKKADRKADATSTARPAPPAPDPAKTPAPRKPKPRDASAPLKFTTPLSPTALAYDGVSKRFIIADRAARRVAVIDENSGQVSTLVGAQGALGDVGGIAIDPQQGDLWVVSAGDNGSTLHKLQLISGRVLTAVEVSGITEPIVSLVFVRGTGLVAADGAGHMWRLASSGKGERIGALEYVPRALASDPIGRLYVTAGGPRLGRYSVTSGLRRLGVVELEDGMPTDMPFVVGADRLHAIVQSDGGYEIRSMRIK